MNYQDLFFILQWWAMFFVIGLIFFPLTAKIFSNFFDKGYIFARILGMALISYVVFVLAILKFAPFTEVTIVLVIIIFLFLNIFLIMRLRHSGKPKAHPESQTPIRDAGQASMTTTAIWKIFVFEEAIFLSILFFWSFIHAHAPDIHGLEKYMDYGFINSILRAEYFPPLDMWLTPYPINYYYFGHLVTAVLTKLSGIPSSITYNLMLSTIFALTFTASLSIGTNLLFNLKSQISNLKSTTQNLKLLLGGLLTAFIVSFAGNLHAIYAFFKPYANESPVPFWQLVFSPQTFPNSYWYPNATRFIHNTIHEFPFYSFVVSDLHGHVLDIPFVLFTIALLFSLLLRLNNHNDLQTQNSKLKTDAKRHPERSEGSHPFFNFNGILQSLRSFRMTQNVSFAICDLRFALLLAFMLAIMYMTNAWDGIIYLILTIFVLFYLNLTSMSLKDLQPKVQSAKFKVQSYSLKLKVFSFELWFYALRFTLYASLVAIGFFLFSLPFSINFKPFASGIGVLCSPEFLTNIGRLGPFLFEKDHCLRSPIWQLGILYGFFYFFVISFIIFLSRVVILSRHKLGEGSLKILRFAQNDITKSDIFVLILIAISTLLIIIPEFIYVKDIYPAHYRANTMFKLVYQAFIMLSISSGYIIIRLLLNWKFKIRYWKLIYWIIGIIGLFLVFIYSYFATNSYYGDLKTYYGLYGTKYLKPLYPTDYEGILWINKNIKGQPVILEAQGDSYTDYARVSSNTGLPTVLGWPVHEWLWRGTYDIPSPRIAEVQKMYESANLGETKELIKKYKVSLVFIGTLERQKYPKLNEEKFKTLGKIIYENGETRIYKVN